MANPERIEKIVLYMPEILRGLFQGTVQSEECYSHSQCKVLYALGFKGALTMSELSNMLSVEMSSATVMVDELVAKELVERTRDEQDRRVVRVSLTKNGQEKFKMLKEQLKKNIGAILDKISENKQKILIEAFEQLYKILTEVEVSK